MPTRLIAATILFAIAPMIAVPAVAAADPGPITKSLPLGSSTAEAVVAFHSGHPSMVACTDEQANTVGDHAAELLTGLLPVLNARLVARATPAGSVVRVDIDATCYPDGTMGLGAYGRGDEKISLRYEESPDGKEWGPPKKAPPITGE